MDKAARKRNKKVLTWVSLALAVALLAAMPLMAQAEAEPDGPVASILSGTVEQGSIQAALQGGGTLKAKDAEDVTLPDGVKITEFLVKNGDSVAQGTPLAAVDPVSVMTAIVEVRETLKYLEEEMEAVRNETVASSICATAGGRVKQIYAQPGDSVQEVMLEHGALAVLSLDGRMAVKLQGTFGLETGDSVQVILADGTAQPGRVEGTLDGVFTISLEDKGYALGESVTVKTGEGKVLGIGSLYIHNAWKATAFTGTVSNVYAREDQTVYAGSTLLTLTDTSFTAELEHLASQHREYEELMQDLFTMQESGAITAPCDGLVSGVDKDSPLILEARQEKWKADPVRAQGQKKGWTVLPLASTDATESTEETQPQSGTYTGYPGMVTGVGSGEIILSMSDLGGEVTQNADGSWNFAGITNFDTTTMIHSGMTFGVDNAEDFAKGDIVVVIYDESGSYTISILQKAQELPDITIPEFDITGGIGGFDFGSLDLSSLMGGMYGMGTMPQEEEPECFPLEGEVLLTLTPQSIVSLTITLDEQDIHSVSLGQSAQVKIEALRGQLFQAEVVEIGHLGTNNGGSSKFTVKLEMPWSENMLDGMSATASIPLYTKPDILTIPVKALAEQGAKTVVFTALDPETGEPTAPVEVKLGMSDGLAAEVLSGLKLGDSFYYSYYDVLELDTNAEVSRFSFG